MYTVDAFIQSIETLNKGRPGGDSFIGN